MKKVISSVFVACFGGFVALTASHFLYENEDDSISQVTHPNQSNIYKLTNSSGTALAGTFADFTMAAEKSVNSVVHIQTVSQQVNNLAYDPFAELFFGPQKRQQSFTQ